MGDNAELEALIGRIAIDRHGETVGKIDQIYLDDATGGPVWLSVSAGRFAGGQRFVPVQGSAPEGDSVRLAVTREAIGKAPDISADSHLQERANDALHAYYHGDVRTQSFVTGGTAMTRSEEQLRVRTDTVETGRARLRKYIVTEQVTVTVPVSHEEIRIEHEPITADRQAQVVTPGELVEEDHEIILHAERPVITKETIPVERIRLGTETVTEQPEITGELRKERIEQIDS